jgi:Rieske 2Fe-2S family protein
MAIPDSTPSESTPEPAGEALMRSLPRAAYVEPDFFDREREAIFWSQWFLAARSEQLSTTGAYRVVDVAGESVILVRGSTGLRAHLNLCRHRGSRLLCGAGDLRGAIVCPYHAWAYAHDGALLTAPHIERSALRAEMTRLHPVGIAEWGGFVFVRVAGDASETPDTQHVSPAAGQSGPAAGQSGPAARQSAPAAAQSGPAPSALRVDARGNERMLEAQLGPARERVANYPLHKLRTVHSLQYDVAANWKVLLENYNECYHCAGVHPELCRIVPAFKRKGGTDLDWENGIPHRDGAVTFTLDGTTTRAPFGGLDTLERVRHKGELVYPNLLLSLSADHVAAFTLWPVGPAQTTVVCDFLFHPDEIAKPGFDPSDAIEFWDLVNRQDWRMCEGVQAGMGSRAFRFGYYAPMEDASLDIRRYLAERLGPDVLSTPPS